MNPPPFLDAIKASATNTTDGNTLLGKLRRVPASDRHDRSAANLSWQLKEKWMPNKKRQLGIHSLDLALIRGME